MSLRLQWVWCVCAAITLGSAASAQSPVNETIAAAVPGATASTISPASTASALVQFPAASPALDGHQRLQWLFTENLGIGSLLDNVVVGAADTFLDSPEEYETHWSGFGKRTGMVAANYGVKSVMEAGLGSIWGEDPRYFRTTGLSMKSRIAYVVKATFLARNKTGNAMPAYSRFVAFPASSFLANEWQPTSDASVTDAIVRVGLGFLSRMGENAWKEFIVPRK